MKPRVALVCYLDAGHKVGAGHLVRSLAVIEQLSFEYHLYIVGNSRLVRETFPQATCINATSRIDKELSRLVCEHDFVILWVDSPAVPAEIWAFEHARMLKVVLDDYGGDHIRADIIVNANAAASRGYTGLSGWTLLLNRLKYLPIRPDFGRAWKDCTQNLSRRRIGFVAGSGTAAQQWAHKLLSLNPDDNRWSRVSMVLSSYTPDHQNLKSIGQAKGISVVSGLDANEMANFYSNCDVCVMTAGMCLYEALASGTPVIAYPILPGMETEVAYFEKQQSIVSLGKEGADMKKLTETVNALLASPTRCRAMVQNGRNLVDGKGVFRITRTLAQAHAMMASGLDKKKMLVSMKSRWEHA